MKKTIKISAVALLSLYFIYAFSVYDESAMELAHERVGFVSTAPVKCKTIDVDNTEWMRCDYSPSSFTAWLYSDGVWYAGNGKAMNLIDRYNKLSQEDQGRIQVDLGLDHSKVPGIVPEEVAKRG